MTPAERLAVERTRLENLRALLTVSVEGLGSPIDPTDPLARSWPYAEVMQDARQMARALEVRIAAALTRLEAADPALQSPPPIIPGGAP